MNKYVAALLALFLFVSLFAVLANLVVATSGVVEDSWTSVSSLPTVRGDLGVTVVNDKIYAIGGTVVHQDTTPYYRETIGVNEEYNPATNSWTTKTPMTVPGSSFATAVYQNKIYCIGENFTEVYDPVTDTWEIKTSAPTNRSYSQANVVNDKIYVIGGYPNDTINEVYDPVTDTWTTNTPMPKGFVTASAVIDNKIYLMGGYTEGGYYDNSGYIPTKYTYTTRVYDPTTDAWSTCAPPPTYFGRGSGSAVITSGVMTPKRIYLIDYPYKDLSAGPKGPYYTNQVYNPANDSWVPGAEIPASRQGFGVVVIDDLIYVIGGYTLTYPSMVDPDQTIYYSYKSDVLRYTPFGYGTMPPKALIVSPQNASSFTVGDIVSFNLTTNRPVDWFGYSLDGADNVTVTGNFTLPNLTIGSHDLTVYARDSSGNVGASEPVMFTVSERSFPVVAAVVGIVVAVAVVVGLFFVFKK